jgi:hypothetical protein
VVNPLLFKWAAHSVARQEAQEKSGFVPMPPGGPQQGQGGMPPGGAPPMDQAMMGGMAGQMMPPTDPMAAAGGGMPPGGAPPPMDPSMMGGAPPTDPAALGGAPPPPPPAPGGDVRSQIQQVLTEMGIQPKKSSKGKVDLNVLPSRLRRIEKLLTNIHTVNQIPLPPDILDDDDEVSGEGGSAQSSGGGDSSGGAPKSAADTLQTRLATLLSRG